MTFFWISFQMLGRGNEWRVFHFTPNKTRTKEGTSEVAIDLRGLLTPLSGETVVIAAEQANSGGLSSILLARQGTFYPLICLCDKHNVLSVHLDLEDAGFVFVFLPINQADVKCGNTSHTGCLYLYIYVLLWHILMTAGYLKHWTAIYNHNYWKQQNYMSKAMTNNVEAPLHFKYLSLPPVGLLQKDTSVLT